MELQPTLPVAPAERDAGERGFALIEMLCVLAIIGMLAAIILPAIPRTTTRARLLNGLGRFDESRTLCEAYLDSRQSRAARVGEPSQ